MFKFIASTFIASFVLIQACIPTAAHAAKTLEEIGLTKADVKNLTAAQIQDILDTATVDYTDNTDGGTSTPVLLPNTVNCFDYYKFGSVVVNISPSVSTGVAGGSINFSGNIVNENAYPIVDGKLIIKIFKIDETNQKNVNGPDVVSEFDVKKDISITANGSLPLSFDWAIPAFLDSGSYQAVAFFTSADKFNLLGLTFTDDIIGTSANFTVKGRTESVRFDKSEVKINGNKFYFAAYPPRISTDEANISATVVNNTPSAQNIPITWKVYSWDGQHPSNFVKEYTQTISVPANGKTEVSYAIADKQYPVYYVRAEAGYKDTKSILNIRFVRPEATKFRINFPALSAFPLVKDQSVNLFSCFHAVSDLPNMTEGKLVLTVEDAMGRNIHSYEYKGQITPSMMGVKDAFIPTKNYDRLTLKAELYQGDKLSDSVVMHYDCKKIDPSSCKDKDMYWQYGALGIIIILVMILIMWLVKRKTNMTKPTIVALFLLGFGLALTPQLASAKEVQWQGTAPRMSTSWGGQRTELENVHMTVTYKAEITKQTGEVLSGGETLPVGTKLNVKFVPHDSDHIYWFGTGNVYDSPYGSWRAGATAPSLGCQDKDFTNVAGALTGASIGSLRARYLFFDLAVEPPQKTITDLQNLSCDALSGDTTTCTVTAAGPVSLSLKYNPTYGKFYYSYFQIRFTNGPQGPTAIPLSQVAAADRAGCLKQGTNFGNYTVNIPTQSIVYGFTAANNLTNQPPTTPIISGPTTGRPGESYNFGIVSTDPDGDTVRYGIDWESSGTINTTVPGSGYVTQGVQQTVSKTWSQPGTYTFKVRAEDQPGLTSAWASYTIVISDNIPNTPPGNNPPTTGGGCTPGDNGCANSCSYVTAIPTGDALSPAGLCLSGANQTNFGPNSSGTGWSWKCQATWQNQPQNCEALCASGIYSPAFGICVDTPFDVCVNLDGDQTDPSLYDIDSRGQCSPKAGRIKYFRFIPDIAELSCPAYWDTEMPDPNLGFNSSCMLDTQSTYAGAAVGLTNPNPGGVATFLMPVGMLHTLTCNVTDDKGRVVKRLDATARCSRIIKPIEN